MATATFDITNGPNKFDLAIALFRGMRDRDEINFSSLNDKKNEIVITCKISSVEMLNRNIESWLISGHAKVPSHEQHYHFTAKFSTQTRLGKLEIKMPE